MECNSCGIKKPKNDAKDFTKAVIEIDNPEQLVLLRKVSVPASLGDDTTYPPKVGQYHNVILSYEANDAIYLYSSDGMPVKVTANIAAAMQAIAQETADREHADAVLQQEIEDIKNSPDVVDIVDTYADLQSYDTSSLGDKDIIRVLQDETHDNDSSYYRWSTTTSSWTFIGSINTNPVTFRPFPSGVDTTHSTQDFMDSILALHPETGMAYLGTVSLSDMPAGLTQEEVEVYVYSGYVIYCVMRSTDVAPYQWWCASYNYQGWRPSGGGSTYTAGANIQISSSNVISATDTTYSNYTGATSQDAGTAGLVPAPLAGDETKFLSGNGQWTTVSQYALPIATANDLGGIKVGTNLSIDSSTGVLSATDTTYSAFTGATSGAAGTSGLVPAPAAGDQDKVLKGDGAWVEKSDKFVIMKYGEANAWAKFLAAYQSNAIVYCRASSNSDPATGAQTRLAFMAYVSDESSPTSVEFQYVRSVSSKTAAQQCDQIFVYKLTSASGGTWSVETRDVASEVVAGTNMTSSYSNGTLTLNATAPTITMTTTDPGEGSALAANNFIGVYGEDPIILDYSTSEINTGAKWVDGSAIYKKTVDIGTLPNSTTKTVAHGISNLDYCIQFWGTAKNSSGNHIVLPWPSKDVVSSAIELTITSTDVSITTADGWPAAYSGYVTLYYTKSS